MRINIIGAGRVAYHLAQILSKQHQIQQVLSRNLTHAERIASQVGAMAIDQYHQLHAAELCVIAVSDQAIAAVAQAVSEVLPDCILVHTSGSTALQKLPQQHRDIGVVYPLQTFSFESHIDWKNTPIFVEGNSEETLQMLQELAQQISERVYAYNSEQRLSLHLAAVFACNFSNYCYDMAKQIVDAQQVDFSLLHPLILETARKATLHDPVTVQTGPAARADQNILNMHQALLQQRQDLQQVYHLLSEQIMHRQTQA